MTNPDSLSARDRHRLALADHIGRTVYGLDSATPDGRLALATACRTEFLCFADAALTYPPVAALLDMP